MNDDNVTRIHPYAPDEDTRTSTDLRTTPEQPWRTYWAEQRRTASERPRMTVRAVVVGTFTVLGLALLGAAIYLTFGPITFLAYAGATLLLTAVAISPRRKP